MKESLDLSIECLFRRSFLSSATGRRIELSWKWWGKGSTSFYWLLSICSRLLYALSSRSSTQRTWSYLSNSKEYILKSRVTTWRSKETHFSSEAVRETDSYLLLLPKRQDVFQLLFYHYFTSSLLNCWDRLYICFRCFCPWRSCLCIDWTWVSLWHTSRSQEKTS